MDEQTTTTETLLGTAYAGAVQVLDAAKSLVGLGGAGSADLLARPASVDTLPGWYQDERALAWESFAGLPMPVRTEQAWRFASLNRISLDGFTPPQEVSEATREKLIERSVGNEKIAGRMVFANAMLLDRRLHAAELSAKGVIWKQLDAALAEHPELFRRHFMAQAAQLGSRKFAALHRANVRTGTFLYVPRDVEITLPLEVFHWLTGEAGSVFPHTLLIAEAGSKVTLIDYYESAQAQESGFACAVNDLVVGAGAKVTYICAQNWGERVTSFQINSTRVERDAHATSLHLNLGAAYARLESLSRLVGPGGRSDMLAATVASDRQEFDQRTLQDHLEPQTASDLLYKNALCDSSRTIFAGLIRVEPAAQHTDAYQKVRNLMLSDDAEANSMPGLEILADEVRCTHGATSGHVEDEEMFYLLSRGIDARTAQELIVQGFLHEVLERLPDAGVRPKLEALLAEKFARLKQARRLG